MLTKNFYAAMMSWLSSYTGSDVGCKLINTNGVMEEVTPINFALKYYYSGSNYTRYDGGIIYDMTPKLSYADIVASGFVLGSGRTPAKFTDFCVEEPLDADLSFTLDGYSNYVWGDDYCEKNTKWFVTNNGSETVSISEFCLCARKCTKDPQYVSSQPTYSSTVFVFDRTVLDTPIVIPAGEMKTLTLAFRMNYPV